MAPEQLEGLEVDARTDLFAFGAVLHEMLTGCRAFEGTSPASVIAAILTAEPTRVSSSVAGSVVSPALDRAVRRALAKDPEERWQTARDLIHELRWIVEDSSWGGAAAPQSKGWSQRYALMTIGAAALIVLGATLGRVTRPPVPARVDEPPTVFEVAAPEGTRLSPGANLLAVSPDSRWVAFIAGPEGGHDRIWLRSLGSPITRPLAGTEDAAGPFWSPDSRSIGFYSRNELERVEIAGGQPTHVAKVARRGLLSLTPSAFWAANDTIVFSELFGLYRVSATGGEPTLVSAPNQARGERSHILPSPLSDGRFLYSVVKRTSEEHEIRVSGLDKPSEVVVPNVGSNAVAASGYLLFRRGESLVAQPFDDDALRLTGQPVTLAEGVGYNPANGRTMFAASPEVLAYRLEVPRTLTWRDRNGRPAGSIGQVGRDRNPAIAPDGSQHVAIDRFDSATNTFGVWTIDEREHSSAVSLAARARFPVWSPDGHWLAFLALGAKGMELRRQPAAAGAGEGETLLQADEEVFPLDWSRDGRFLIYQAGQPGDLWALPLVGSRTPVQVTATPWRESFARLSPDGHWIAYTSDESGQDDVWVQAFPSREEKRKISVNGGIDPTWRADGKELFYLARDGTLVAIPVSAGATLTTGKPSPLFHTTEGAWHFGPLGLHLYSAAPDGQRFLVNEATEAQDRITVVVHWTSLVRH